MLAVVLNKKRLKGLMRRQRKELYIFYRNVPRVDGWVGVILSVRLATTRGIEHWNFPRGKAAEETLYEHWLLAIHHVFTITIKKYATMKTYRLHHVIRCTMTRSNLVRFGREI